jgi:hypothetical protein
MAHVQDMRAGAERVLIELYLIRDRLATMAQQAAVLAASFRTN